MSEQLIDAPHVPSDAELDVLRNPKARWLAEAFEWTPANADTQSIEEDIPLAPGCFRLIPSIAERAGVPAETVVDFYHFKKLMVKAALNPPSKKSKHDQRKPNEDKQNR
jgi:hypothetical protein